MAEQQVSHQRVGTLFARGSATDEISDAELADGLKEALTKLGARHKVMLLPPDITRLMSKAGELTCAAYEHYGDAVSDVMPALGTHTPMSRPEIEKMYPGIPLGLFREHDWRGNTMVVGTVPAEVVEELSDGLIVAPWNATLNRMVVEGGHDLLLSVGQVVPHECLGMANFTKNLFIGVAGAETINFTHHICAVFGVENIMGRADTPGRRLFQKAYDEFTPQLPALFAMTVIGPDTTTGKMVTRGLFVGDTMECFEQACKLSLEVNFTMIEPQRKIVCYMDPEEYHFLWTANKAIYRTRLAVADGGELLVLAPGVHSFGEKPVLDKLIRRHGYITTPEMMQALETDPELADNLVAAAHMMLSSSENRFSITYCPSDKVSQAEIEKANFKWAPLEETLARYDPKKLKPGPNTLEDGEEIYFVPAPGSGLWAAKNRFLD